MSTPEGLRPHEVGAGDWVGFFDFVRDGLPDRSYPYSGDWSWTSSADDSRRYTTRKEALADVKRRRGGARKGVRIGAARIGQAIEQDAVRRREARVIRDVQRPEASGV